MLRLFFISGILLLLASCRKEANVKLPATKPLPVMYAYICPDDSLILLKLMSSAPLYSSNEIDVMAAVPNADVRISGAQGTAKLVFNDDSQYYELETAVYPILPGQTYKMTVTTANGDVATAETHVPYTIVPIQSVTVETVKETYESSDRVKVYFTDEPGTVNYYRLAASHVFVYKFQPDTMAEDTHINELYTDINHDGESASLTGRFYQRFDSTAYTSVAYYDVFLYNCSPEYYNFHKSVRNYAGDDPFTEPTLIYTNVKGGFGCFSAYTRSRIRFKKK